MSTWLIVTLAICGVIVLGVLGYFLLGRIFWVISLKRNNIIGKAINKEFAKMLKRYRISYSWWDKVKLEKIEYMGSKNTNLVAHYALQSPKKWAILVHGYEMDYKNFQQHAKIFYDEGFSICLPINRGHGESGGEGVSMGFRDADDVLILIKKLIKEQGENIEIVVMGISMGGTTVCLLSGKTLPKNVKCIISDCAYANAYDQFKFVMANRLKMTEFPALPILESYNKIKEGYFLKDIDAVETVKKSKLPILFIHGDNDTFVPCHNVFELYANARPKTREILIVNDADHSECLAKRPILYKKKVFEFVDKYVK